MYLCFVLIRIRRRGIRGTSLLGSLQLCVFLYELLESEPWKLYRNLGAFTFAFPAVDHAFAVLRMADALAGTKRRPAGFLLRRLGRGLGQGKFLAPRGEEFRDVVNGVVPWTRVAAAAARGSPRPHGLAIG